MRGFSRGVFVALALCAYGHAQDSFVGPYWIAHLPSQPTAVQTYDVQQSPAQNGAALASVIATLGPGSRLEIDPGPNPGLGGSHYVLPAGFEIHVEGRERWPIGILGAPSSRKPVLTKAGNEDILIVGDNAEATRFCMLANLDLTGGGVGLTYRRVEDLWVDGLHVHHTGGGGIKGPIFTPASYVPERLYLTNNEIHHTQSLGNVSYGEGIRVKLSASTIGWNYVHHTDESTEGDGIQIESGSYGNRIVGNVVHDTRYPCFYVVGDDGSHPGRPTVFERNIAWNSGDNVFQFEDGAYTVIRDNLFCGPNANKIFDSSHGSPRYVEVINNTFVAGQGFCAGLFAWKDDLPGLVFANNIAYSEAYSVNTYAVYRPDRNTDGTENTTGSFYGNVTFGNVKNLPAGSWVTGNGLSDFAGVSSWTWLAGADTSDWSLLVPGAMPSAASAFIGACDAQFREDLLGQSRDPGSMQAEAGCLELVSVP